MSTNQKETKMKGRDSGLSPHRNGQKQLFTNYITRSIMQFTSNNTDLIRVQCVQTINGHKSHWKWSVNLSLIWKHQIHKIGGNPTARSLRLSQIDIGGKTWGWWCSRRWRYIKLLTTSNHSKWLTLTQFIGHKTISRYIERWQSITAHSDSD